MQLLPFFQRNAQATGKTQKNITIGTWSRSNNNNNSNNNNYEHFNAKGKQLVRNGNAMKWINRGGCVKSEMHTHRILTEREMNR